MTEERKRGRRANRPGCTHSSKYTNMGRHSSHLGGFDLVAGAAGPAGQVRQHLTLLSVHTRLHVAPPLLGYDGG